MSELYGLIGFVLGLGSGLLSVLIGGHLYSRANLLRSPITGTQVQPAEVSLPFIARTDADEARIEREMAADSSEEVLAKSYRDSISGLGRNG